MPTKIKYPIVNGKKQCGDCKKFLSISEFKKARNYYTSRCHKCLSIYAAKYRARLEVKLKSKEYHKKYMKLKKNRLRANALMRKYTKTKEYKIKRNKNRREWALRQKLLAIKYGGGKCMICGYSKCMAALDFHHKKPLEKNGYGTGALKAHWTFEKNKRELNKCVLVCVRCHREIHAGMIKL